MKNIDQIVHTKFCHSKGRVISITILIVFSFLVFGASYNYGNILILIVGLIIAIILFLITTGTELDLSEKLYRDYKKIGPIKWGKWKPLGEFDFLLISKSSKRSQVSILPTVVSINNSSIY